MCFRTGAPDSIPLPSTILSASSTSSIFSSSISPTPASSSPLILVEAFVRHGDIDVFVVHRGHVDLSQTYLLVPDHLAVEVVGFVGHGRDFSIFRTVFLQNHRSAGFRHPPFLLVPHLVGFPLFLPRDDHIELLFDKSRVFFSDLCSSYVLSVQVSAATRALILNGFRHGLDASVQWHHRIFVDEMPEAEFEEYMAQMWVRAYTYNGGQLRSPREFLGSQSDSATLVEENVPC